MSIYSSTWSVDADDHADACARWVLCTCGDPLSHPLHSVADDRHWRYAPDRACTCQCAPIVYQGSHVLPHPDDARGGTLGLAEISGYITRDGRDDGPEDEDTPWPYLRVTIRAEGAPDCQDVVLDRGQYIELRDYLTSLIERTEAP